MFVSNDGALVQPEVGFCETQTRSHQCIVPRDHMFGVIRGIDDKTCKGLIGARANEFVCRSGEVENFSVREIQIFDVKFAPQYNRVLDLWPMKVQTVFLARCSAGYSRLLPGKNGAEVSGMSCHVLL